MNPSDIPAEVFGFALTLKEAEAIAEALNSSGVTRNGKFIPGTFLAVDDLPGRYPAVMGALRTA